jgi:hypothetical protein
MLNGLLNGLLVRLLGFAELACVLVALLCRRHPRHRQLRGTLLRCHACLLIPPAAPFTPM